MRPRRPSKLSPTDQLSVAPKSDFSAAMSDGDDQRMGDEGDQYMSDEDDRRMFVFRDDRPRDFQCDDFVYEEPDPRPDPFSPYPQPERYPGERAAQGQRAIEAFLERATKAGDAHYAKVKRDLDAQKQQLKQTQGPKLKSAAPSGSGTSKAAPSPKNLFGLRKS